MNGKRRIRPAPLALAALVLASGTASGSLPLGDLDRASRARDAILEMELGAARAVLEGADPSDPSLALEQGRLFIYDADCDAAAALLARPDLAATREGAALGDIARGCARATAATVVVEDQPRGIWVRLQDDDDRAFVPLLAEVADRVRAVLAKDLGVELPRPLRIDLVRDQHTLAAHTGLPLEAAQTTGTVAVAKWGRVIMISPRATLQGYGWLDTLAHEMTHLALSRGTRDNAPLWLQEGVAKREEVRWRAPDPLDDIPPVDAVALLGLEKGLGRPLDKLGPSIAMLPTAEEASVAFAEVASFIRYWAAENGDDALPQLLVRLKEAHSAEDVDRAIAAVSGADLAGWDKRWRGWLSATPRDVPQELLPWGSVPNRKEVAKRLRLGELLDERGHHTAAATQLARAQVLAPHEATARSSLAAALLASGEKGSAAPLVEKVEDVRNSVGRWWSLHGLLHGGDGPEADQAFWNGVGLNPLDPDIACEEKPAPALPADAVRAGICETARRAPR
ncbi:peptidase MA family metallohydrolase [Chondromyces apiculatus]|uniref:Peptidase MA-like domain-containing protein n=1 Tax=Chondromyces apiculatus DSM 436 TaxID=1192034 RepID=A0A017TAB8_9BACT|nr:hypothetical protein [Chondromyces apiculatus]EYF06228.1 Hypothetical protein CAP_2106 [Chondromyces apiculatus DSM 436]